MLFIKGNRIYTASFSFELPQGLSIITDPTNVTPDTLTFETLDGKFLVEIGASDTALTPKEEVDYIFDGDTVIVKQSEIMEIDRYGMKGLGFFYRGEMWNHEYYEEFLSYPRDKDDQALLNFCVQHEVEDEADGDKVKDFMMQDNIKAFIDSIRYEPDVCKQVIQGN